MPHKFARVCPTSRSVTAIRRAVGRIPRRTTSSRLRFAQISPKLREAIGRGGVAVLWGSSPVGRNSMPEALYTGGASPIAHTKNRPPPATGPAMSTEKRSLTNDRRINHQQQYPIKNPIGSAIGCESFILCPFLAITGCPKSGDSSNNFQDRRRRADGAAATAKISRITTRPINSASSRA
jgi:hypothetical protein